MIGGGWPARASAGLVPRFAGCAVAADAPHRWARQDRERAVSEARIGYVFEWDARKAVTNLRRHGVSFDEATSVFGDPLAILMPDPDRSVGETEVWCPGLAAAEARRGPG
ncbi:MAG: BrnT family toxin, partial [Myxococcota bacterium]|nr:BrnT family toxin [Myxococcota bacterium]